MGRGSPTPTDTVIPVDSAIVAPDLPFSTTHRPTKRYTHAEPQSSRVPGDTYRPADRRRRRSDIPRPGWVAARKVRQSLTDLCFYCTLLGVAVLFVMAMTAPRKLVQVGQQVATPWGVGSSGKGVGEVLRFVPRSLMRRFAEREEELKVLRSTERVGVRPPRLGLVLGSMKKNHLTLMLLTLAKAIREHGYNLEIFAMKDGEAHSLWNRIGHQLTILNSENASYIDWSIYEGVILSSLEARNVITSLKQEPFDSVPLIWIIQEDALAKRLPVYEESGWMHLIVDWRNVFDRVDVVVFPDFSLPMLHSALDTGNFFVIPGSPMEVWSADMYLKSHSKSQLRKDSGYHEDDLLISVIGNSLFFDGQLRDYDAVLHFLGPCLGKFAKMKGLERRFKLLFLCRNTMDGHDYTFQEIASNLGFPHDAIQCYGLEDNVNAVLLMADIVLHTVFQDEQSFPPLLLRAMSFGIPIIVPDMPIIKQYIVDKVTGFIYHAHNSETLTRAFSHAISETGLSDLAHLVANSERLLSKDMLAVDCLTMYMKLLENVVHFPSDTILPLPVAQLKQRTWEWRLLEKDMKSMDDVPHLQNSEDEISTTNDSIVYFIESKFSDKHPTLNIYHNNSESFNEDFPTKLDWEEIEELEFLEDIERFEVEELEERTEKTLGSWEYVYNAARKSDKKKYETFEQDEGELERIGRPLCIYEIYNGAGSWPFLHHGTIYRGISLSKGVKRSRSDDIDGVERLPLLGDKHYNDLLCEFGGMLSIANKVDRIHKISWIGFQSWRAAGRKVALEASAENILEETIIAKTDGDVLYFWAKMEIENKKDIENGSLSFWSTCDILNGGNCRSAFEDAFRKMYGLPSNMPALPPMPADGDYWSVLHGWVMPTPSFLEFIMFARMFVDSVNSLDTNATNSCFLASSKLESKHCYCRVTELLVNVWAYHSARKMVYVDPTSGELKEQHPVEQRKGQMWAKFFNFTLLKAMDEDLAEEADDGLRSKDGWLWPFMGEVHWPGILDRERAERFRRKENKRKKSMEKLLERQKHGYKQKALGG